MKKTIIFLFLIFVAALLASCSEGALPDVEVTHLSEQPVETISAMTPEVIEVTRIVYQTVVVTQIDHTSIPTTPTPATPSAPLSPQDIEAIYFDGAMVITQYYTLLSQGLFEEAYQLLSPSRPNPQNLDDFLMGAENVFQTVDLYKVQPYYLWSSQEDTSLKDTNNQIQYYVEVYVDGEDGWASIPYGVWNPIVTVVRENDRWFIYTFDSITTH